MRKGSRYGVRLKASAKAIHMFQTNIRVEISPEIGGENASSEILGFLLQKGLTAMLNALAVQYFRQANLHDHTGGCGGKAQLPADESGRKAPGNFAACNEGSGTLICIIL